ncbi:MAG TPA: hypothetical protein VFT74_00775, partial [Isosphaeraceae bacterium]|nr:hypothetical protein [Isosphaeraceae bacterium]
MSAREVPDAFREVWLTASESAATPGERADPVCLVGRELRSGQSFRLCREAFWDRRTPPYSVGPTTLFVAYDSSWELAAHHALGWPMPERVLDLSAEFRCHTAGLDHPHGAGLFGALSWKAQDTIGAIRRLSLVRMLARRGPWTEGERNTIVAGCEAKVEALGRLLPAMAPTLDWPRALLRGRYMSAVARMEQEGVPIDVPTLQRLRHSWGELIDHLIRDVDSRFGVFDGRRLRSDWWEAWLVRNRLAWPRHSD